MFFLANILCKDYIVCLFITNVYNITHLSWKLSWAFPIPFFRRLSVCASLVCKPFTFSTSSPGQKGLFPSKLGKKHYFGKGDSSFLKSMTTPSSKGRSFIKFEILLVFFTNLILENHGVKMGGEGRNFT